MKSDDAHVDTPYNWITSPPDCILKRQATNSKILAMPDISAGFDASLNSWQQHRFGVVTAKIIGFLF